MVALGVTQKGVFVSGSGRNNPVGGSSLCPTWKKINSVLLYSQERLLQRSQSSHNAYLSWSDWETPCQAGLAVNNSPSSTYIPNVTPSARDKRSIRGEV